MHFALGVLKEIIFIFISLFAVVLGYLFPLTETNKNPLKDRSIVFIHGLFSQNLLHYFLKRHLEKKGYRVYMTNFGLLTGDIAKNSKLLSDYVTNNNLKDIVLVGASEGAIISLYYLQKLDGWTKVNKFISVGGPFKGFPLARLAFFSLAAKQMSANSDFLKDLFNGSIQNTQKIICISSKFDEIIPSKSSKIEGAINETLRIVGHINLIAFSNDVHKLIANYASSENLAKS